MADQVQATVELHMLGKLYTLRPTLPAKRAVSRYAGGYTGMLQALNRYDVDSMVFTILAGTETRGKAANAIEEAAYATNAEALLPPLVRFVRICMAGGVDPDAGSPKPPTEPQTGDAT